MSKEIIGDFVIIQILIFQVFGRILDFVFVYVFFYGFKFDQYVVEELIWKILEIVDLGYLYI